MYNNQQEYRTNKMNLAPVIPKRNPWSVFLTDSDYSNGSNIDIINTNKNEQCFNPFERSRTDSDNNNQKGYGSFVTSHSPFLGTGNTNGYDHSKNGTWGVYGIFGS